ncbi:hypothetical protein FHR67_000086 [Xanthomonas arboricola]|nr:hypothetical protein [Xanthomonas campestris]
MTDRLDHRIQRKQYIVVPEPQHCPSLRLKPPRPCLIAGCLMLRSIELNNQPYFHATEIRDVRWNWMLAPELETLQLIAA